MIEPSALAGVPPLVDTHLPRKRKVILVMDLVESVRLMANREVAVIELWRGFVRHAAADVFPPCRGQLVKSLGDGILVTFETASDAMRAVHQLHQHFGAINQGLEQDQRLHLRAGLNTAEVFLDDIDVYGNGVNLAARVASLAGPGETVITVPVRDELTEGLDARLEDLGERFLKHVDQPVRVYRATAPHAPSRLPDVREMPAPLQPTVAVIPFSALSCDRDAGMALGDAIADDIIAALSRSVDLRVISRLSTAPLRDKAMNLQDVCGLLGAAYVVSGSYSLHGGKAMVRVQLSATHDGQLLWADGMVLAVADMFHGQDPLIPTIAAHVGRAILHRELERARLLPVSTLESYTVYLGGIAMLHRLGRSDFMRSRDLLEHVHKMHPRNAAPQAMLAKWHLLHALQGWAPDSRTSGAEAQSHVDHALALEPDHALALAMKGILEAHFGHELETARALSLAATRSNPHEPHGWLHLAAASTYLEDTAQIETHVAHALALSPLDPARFGFEAFLGAAKLVCGKYDEAATAAQSSIRLNAMHPASHRLLTIALVGDGKMSEARLAAQGLLKIAPSFTVSAYAAQYPGRHAPHAASHLDALREAGIPS